MVRSIATFAVGLGVAVAALAQAPAPPEPPREVKYEAIGAGVHAAELFATDRHPDVVVQVRDLLLGPGKAAPDLAVRGVEITEVKSGEVETTIDSVAVRRRPGDFWLVHPGQRYAIRSLAGMAVLHTVVFLRK
jgi:hypothetical protein